MSSWSSLGGLTLGTLFALGAGAQDVVIRDATIYTLAAAGTLKNTDLLMHAGNVVAVGQGLKAPADATAIEAHGRALTPGIFGGLTDIGVTEIEGEAQTVDSVYEGKAPAWNQRWRPELDVTQAFNPRSVWVPVTRVEGITWTLLAPGTGDSIMAGQGAAVSLDGRYAAVLEGSRTLFVQMGSEGARHAGGTRAAEYMLLDQAIAEARGRGAASQGDLLHAAGRDTLVRYLGGGRVAFEVDRAADILAVIAFAQHNGMKPIIVGGSEAWVVGNELAKAQVPVILNPLEDLPLDFDHLDATLENAARLQRAGAKIAFSSGDSENSRLARQLAGNAVAHGLPWDAALAAITSNPADMLGLGATRGRIVVGHVADLVLWSGDPLELSTLADAVWIEGRPVDMRSRQTELRDRYLRLLKAGQAR